MAPRQELRFDILAEDHASRGFLNAGRAASAASDDVMGLARRLDEISKKTATARVALAGDKEALAQLDKLDMKLLTTGRRVTDPKITIDGAAKASLEITGLDAELDKLSAKSAKAAVAVGPGAGGLAGPSGMGALIGAGVALSPIITTIGIGTAGFGIAAAGAVAPVLKAAQAAGGLEKNMSKLDPEQQKVAQGLLGLGQQYRAFEQALQPTVLKDFSGALRIAGHLMGDLEPVSQATGKAIGTLLDAVDKEFASGTWQQFFGFMAKTAAPDMKLVSDNLVGLMDTLPPLLESMQPTAEAALRLSAAFFKAADGGAELLNAVSQLPPANTRSADSMSSWAESVTNRWIPGATSVNHWLRNIQGAFGDLPPAVDKAAGSMAAAGPPSRTLGTHIAADAVAVKGLMTAEQNALNTQTTYAGGLVTTANDAKNLRDMLKLSAGRIGLHTQAERDSFGAANTYITDLGNTASAAVKSGHGVDAAIKAISSGLPILDSATTKNRAYWQEVRTLKGWLDKLRAEKNIRELVIVTGQGTWTMHNPKGQSLPGGYPGGTGAARGLKVTGGVPGKDSVPIMAMPGEAVVPTHLVPPLAPFLKANKVPGFAAGGIVPSFAGSVAGEGRWAAADNRAAVKGLETGLASIIITAVRRAQKAQAAQGGGGFGVPGPGGGAPSANAALARRMFPSVDFASWNYVAMRESGWNQFARNPSSGAYGIPQALPPSKMGPAANPPQSNVMAQLSWMVGYMNSRYGGAGGAAAHERAFNWYDSGVQWLPPGPSLAYNGTGRYERVGGEDLAPLLRQVITELRKLPGVQAAQLGRVLSGRPVAPRPSVFAAR